jgi:hypothetical protein
MWHIDPLLCNDCETNKTMTTVMQQYWSIARQWPMPNNVSTAGSGVSIWSALRLYHLTDQV